ncbi:MAG: InlB B-repeat-containing protein, partial [Eubacterium sp.]|nr:InlB B-repeat-containing protein [Eubacterium sp.]
MLTGVTLDGTTVVAAAAFDQTYVTADTAISPVIEPNSFSFEFVKEDQEFSELLNGVTNGDTANYGTDVTFTLTPVSGAAVYSVCYTVGDDLTTYSLTPDSSDVYTIDGTAILGDIKVYINVKKYHEITLSQGEGNEMTAITGYVWDSLAGIYKTVPGLGTRAETYTASEISAAPSEAEGYRLAADSADEPLWTDGTSFYTTAALTGTQTFTADTALTAVSIKQYTVTFASGGNGTVEETSRVVDTGSTLGTLPTVTPTGYYTFSGWEIGSDTYTDTELLALTITEDITVTALFEPSKYSVTFANSNYGTFEAVSGVDADGYGAYLTDIVFTFNTTENGAVKKLNFQFFTALLLLR